MSLSGGGPQCAQLLLLFRLLHIMTQAASTELDPDQVCGLWEDRGLQEDQGAQEVHGNPAVDQVLAVIQDFGIK